MRRNFSLPLIFLLLSVLLLAACGGDDPEPTSPPVSTDVPTDVPTEEPVPEETEESNMSPIPEEIEVQSDFTILVEALEAANLIDMLSGNVQHTIFAPTDAAFETYLESQDLTKDALFEDTEALTDLLYYHLVSDWMDTIALVQVDEQFLTTLNGEMVTFAIDEAGDVVLNDTVTVLLADVIASTGVIHAVDGVLTVPMVVVEPEDTMELEPEETAEPVNGATEEPADDEDDEAVEATEESEVEPELEMTEEPEMTDAPEPETTESP